MKKYSQLFSSLLVVLMMLNVMTPTFVYAAESEEGIAVEATTEEQRVEQPVVVEETTEEVLEKVVEEQEEPTQQQSVEQPVVEEPEHPTTQTKAEVLEEVNEETEEVLEVRGMQAAGNELSVTIDSASIVGSKDQYYNGEQIGINVNWSLPAGTVVQPGDYFTVSYPSFLNVANQTLAMNHGTCEASNGVMTCTFDDRVNGQDNLSGGFEFGAQLKFQENSGKHNETIYINGVAVGQVEVDAGDGSTGNTGGTTGRDFGKWGTRSMEDPSIINWTVELNGDKKYDMMTFTDTPGHGHKIIPGSVTVGINGKTVTMPSQHVENFSVTEDSISMQLRTYRLDYPAEKYGATIYYSTKITDENVKGWSNTATMTPYGGQTQSTETFVEKFGGAWSQGELSKHTGSFELVKKGPNGELLAGATFNLVNHDGEVVKTITTNEEGKAFVENIPGGHYSLVEVTAPEGFMKLENPVNMTLKFDQNKVHVQEVTNEYEPIEEKPILPEKPEETFGSISLMKVDAANEEVVLEGAVFNLYKKDGTLVQEGLVTDENGEIKVEDLEEGEYYFTEVTAPEGYTLSTENHFVTVEIEAIAAVTVKNEKEEPLVTKGSLQLVKVDADDHEKVLEGAVFELQTEDGTVVAKNLVTDENGQITVSDLEEGTYYFHEVKAPEGYTIKEGATSVQVTPGAVQEVTVENTPEEPVEETPEEPTTPEPEEPETPEVPEPEVTKASVKLVKVDAANKEIVLEGAVFNLYNEADELVQENITTNAEGMIEVTELDEGAYYFQEVKAPEGYTLDRAKVEFTAENDQAVTITVTNEKTPEEPVEPTPPTPEEPEEPTPPAPVEPMPVKASVELVKVDASDNEQTLEGAVFNLYKEDGTLVQENVTTNAAGIITVTGLDEGAYYFQEVKAPEGYTLDDAKITFEAKDDHKVHLAVSNMKIPETPGGETPEEPESPETPGEETPETPEPEVTKTFVKLVKVDARNHNKVLEGAIFNLYKADGTEVATDLKTDQDGVILIENLEEGDYYFVEKRAPKGYKLSRDKHTFTVAKDENVEVTIENKKRPSGGGGGTPPPTESPETPGEETPEEPESPETPGEETPEEPESPETPGGETPEEPESPETPGGEMPEEPEVPETPEGETSETPTTPEVTTPGKPTTPEGPVVEAPEKEKTPTVSEKEVEQPTKGNVLPQTGEAMNSFILFVAALLIMIGGIFTFRRTETK